MKSRSILVLVLMLALLAGPIPPAAGAAKPFVPADHLSALGREMMGSPSLAPELGRAVAARYQTAPLSLAAMMETTLTGVQGEHLVAPPVTHASLSAEIARAYVLAGSPMSVADQAALAMAEAKLDPRVASALAALVAGQTEAQQLRGDPWRATTPEDLRILVAHASIGKPYVTGGTSTLLGATEPTDLMNAERAVADVDVASLARAHLAMAQAVDMAVADLRGVAPSPPSLPRVAPPGDVFSADTPYGLILVSGAGPNTHAQDAFVDIDLGGDDVYTSRAGGVRADILGVLGAQLPPDPTDPSFPAWADATMTLLHNAHNASVVLDLSGNDVYAFTGGPGAQGYGGFGGFGALVDFAGDDHYSASTFAQGAGQVAGAGFLVDGVGNDDYQLVQQGQGFGQDAGAGFLSDATGSDHYHALVLAQGTGYSANLVGLLLDGAGDDTYDCTGVIDSSDSILPVNAPRPGSICHATGFGGTGILVDGQGDDAYTTASSFQAMTLIGTGVLVDSGGRDVFSAGEWSNAVAVLGAAVIVEGVGDTVYHSKETVGPWADVYVGSNSEGYLGSSALVDGGGNDLYESVVTNGQWIPQYACGSSCVYAAGSALLIDAQGDDHYVSEVGQGGAQPGAAVLLEGGGNDVYTLTPNPDDARTQGQGFAGALPLLLVVLPVRAADCYYGVLDDLGGTDSYSNPTTTFGVRGDGQYWGQNDFGRGMDGTEGNTAYLTSAQFQADAAKIVNTNACDALLPPAQVLACALAGNPAVACPLPQV